MEGINPVVLVAVWLACGAICAAMADAFNRPKGLWFAYGVVFGIFGVLFLLALGKDKRQEIVVPPRRDL